MMTHMKILRQNKCIAFMKTSRKECMNHESWKSNKHPGGMGRKCLRYHSRLAELISLKKGEDYAKTLGWIRGKVSFSILRSALLCLRGSRSIRRRATNVKDIDVDLELARSRV